MYKAMEPSLGAKSAGMAFVGRWSADQLQVHWVAEPVRPAVWQEEIDREWEELKAEKPQVYDAPLASLRDFQATVDSVRLSLGKSSFRFTAITHGRPDHYRQLAGEQGLGMGMASAVGIHLTSGELVLGRRSQTVHRGTGKWHPIAGHFDYTRHVNSAGTSCPFQTVYVEAFEELCLEAHQLEGLTLIGLQIHADVYKPELHFTATTRLTISELSALQRQAEDAHELESLMALRVDQVPQFLAGDFGPITGVSRAAVETHLQLGLFAAGA